MNVSFVVGAPLAGWLSDRVLSSRKKVVLAGLAGLAAAELALALAGPAPRIWLVAAALATLGLASSFGQVVYAHMKDLVPEGMAGMAMSGVNFFTMLGGAAFVHGTGWVLDRGADVAGARGPDGYRAAFLASSLVVASALALYSFTRDPRVGSAAEHARRPDLTAR
jgi:MFS family permease